MVCFYVLAPEIYFCALILLFLTLFFKIIFKSSYSFQSVSGRPSGSMDWLLSRYLWNVMKKSQVWKKFAMHFPWKKEWGFCKSASWKPFLWKSGILRKLHQTVLTVWTIVILTVQQPAWRYAKMCGFLSDCKNYLESWICFAKGKRI